MKLWLLSVMILLISHIRVGQAQAETKPVLTVHPNVSQVIRGQTVTLSCTISGGSGSYHWYQDGVSVHVSAENDYTIIVDQSHKYSCYISEDGWSPTTSNEVALSVIERPKAVVTLQPDGEMFTGEKITLTCEIRGDSDNELIYNWYKDGVQLFTSVEKNEYSFTPAESFSSKYTCSGKRKGDSQSSDASTAVTLTVSEKPKPELTSNRKGDVLTGNLVTLTCKLKSQSAGWRFSWIKPTQKTETETETHFYTINSVKVSDGGQYRCRAGRGNPVYYTDYSDALWVKVTESPKAVVTIKPDKHVFRGETVTFTCEIQGKKDTEWKYSWYDNYNRPFPDRTTQEFSLSPVRNEHSGKYTCIGWRSSDTQMSEISDVTLTVSDEAEAVVRVSPLSWLTEGDSVTLNCEVKHSTKGWTFSWYTDIPYRDHLGSLRYKTALLSDSSRGSGGSYTLSPVTLNHTGVYWCRAARGEQVFHTKYSNRQPLWITAESPPVSLIINPSRTQHFTTDSLSLSCEDQSNSTGWTVRGYTHSEALFTCSSVSGATCNIGSLSTSHTGVYWCQSESGGRSNPINITVHNGNVILDSPVRPVTEGHPLTLRCLYRFRTVSDSGIDFYKDGSVCQNNTKGEMTITNVSKSDEGFYHCKYLKKGESLKSRVSVSLQSPRSNIVIVAVAVGLSLTLLLIIISVILLWRHKSNKGKDKGQQQKSNQPQGLNQSGAEDSQTGDTPLQTDVAGPSDVTYAELDLKPQKKARKNQVKADVESDTVYSELKKST